jgi:hypothetical protein
VSYRRAPSAIIVPTPEHRLRHTPFLRLAPRCCSMRRTGALVALATAFVLVLFPSIEKLKHAMLFVYTIYLLGFAAVLLATTLHLARTRLAPVVVVVGT